MNHDLKAILTNVRLIFKHVGDFKRMQFLLCEVVNFLLNNELIKEIFILCIFYSRFNN